jgi:hypothetical protein
MRYVFTLILSFALFMQPAPPTVLYVAPYGTAAASGTSDEPRTLASALCAGCTAPGATVWLMPGTYSGPFVANVSGTQSAPIVLRSVPGTRARLDGKLDILGAYTTWRDLELTYTGWLTRTSTYAGSSPPDIPNTDLYIVGVGTRIERSHIHDIRDVGWWSTSFDGAFVDNVIYSIGHKGLDRGHGHGLYTQNRIGGSKLIQNVISGGNYSTCGKIYGVTAELKNYTVDGLVCWGSGDPRFLVGGENGTADNIRIKNSFLFGAQLSVGNRHPNPLTPTGAITITDNIIAHPAGIPFVATYWRDLSFTANTVIGGAASDPANRYLIKTVSQRPAWVFNQNAYRYGAVGTRVMKAEGIAEYTFAQWQALGYDPSSTVAYTLPTTNTISVRSSGAHRGTVVVYNWAGLTSVSVDLSTLNLTPGAIYHLTNAQNPAERQAFTAGVPVSLPMAGWTVATPIGATSPLTTWDTRFGVFLVAP